MRTPAGHPLIRGAWTSSAALLVVALVVGVVGHAARTAAIVAGAAAGLFTAAYVAYLVRHLLFLRTVSRAEAALARGDLETARATLAPLLELYPHLAPVQRAAGLVLYRLGDPLSSATLLERAARSYAGDVEVATTLVASYAALNRGGDARRATQVAPTAVDVRLALAWSELVALGGDRSAGIAMAGELAERADVRADAARRAMTAALRAIAASRRLDATTAETALRDLAGAAEALPAYERAFLGYLEGVALRELGRASDAVAAFERAMEASPGTIGEALARRERANLLARLAPPSQTGQAHA